MSVKKEFFESAILDNISVVLVEPKGPMNVGAAARAINNAGLRNLVLVNPCDFTGDEAKKMASGCNETLIGARVFKTTAEAVSDSSYVVGMTCRVGRYRTNLYRPDEMAQKIIPLANKNKVSLLFGTERTGLANEDIALCDALVTIPTSPLNRSLNLAQAVLIVCYEIFNASGACTIFDDSQRILATSEEKEMMYKHMEDVFGRIGYLQPENPEHMMMSIRNIFGRTDLDSRDVRILRGMIGKIDCYAGWVERGKKRRKSNSREVESNGESEDQ